MKLSLIPSFFKPKRETLVVPDSLLLKKIKLLSENSNILLFSQKEIFHHKSIYPITLLIYDNLRGLYIFEIKEWSYDDLKNATASKAESVENSNNTLAFDKTHSIIKKKFNELLHNDGVEIFNYLLMENLSSDEYEHLNDSLKEILPKEKIIFSDSDTSEIFKKLQDATEEDHSLPSADIVLGTLFIQYAIVNATGNINLCNQEQIDFLDKPIQGIQTLKAPPKSGKSYLLLLKSIQDLFKKRRKKIILIKPTMLSKDILYKRFLELIEHAIIDIDLMAFEILTPTELINRHLNKLKMPRLSEELFIHPKLMKKSFDIADLILCDDTELISDDFILYLKHIQKKADLLLLANDDNATFTLTQSYLPTSRVITFEQTYPYARVLHLVSSLLQKYKADEIVLILNEESRSKLEEDLRDYIEENPLIIDGSQHLVDQKFNSILLTTYNDIVEIEAKHVIIMDIENSDENLLHYAYNLATQTVHILYEEISPELELLKEKYEDEKDRATVEEPTLS